MMQDHWNGIYESATLERLGWYQPEPQPDLGLIEQLDLDHTAPIVLAGVGTSTLVSHLYQRGYTNLILTDISQQALNRLQQQLPPQAVDQYQWIVDDLSQPQHLPTLDHAELWFDRAVLHFLTDPRDRAAYQSLLHTIRPHYLFLAEFSTIGATRCSGLDVYQYDLDRYQQFVGSGYQLLREQEYLYIMPSGDPRPYIYCIFERI